MGAAFAPQLGPKWCPTAPKGAHFECLLVTVGGSSAIVKNLCFTKGIQGFSRFGRVPKSIKFVTFAETRSERLRELTFVRFGPPCERSGSAPGALRERSGSAPGALRERSGSPVSAPGGPERLASDRRALRKLSHCVRQGRATDARVGMMMRAQYF